MAEFQDSIGRIPSRIAALAGWLVVLGAVGGLGVVSQPVPGTSAGAKEGPFAEAAAGEHAGPVWSLAFAPGDGYLASATIAGEVWIKDLATDRSRRLMDGPNGSSRSLAFSPDNRTLTVVGGGAAGRQWEVATGAELEPLAVGEPDAITNVAVSPDGSLMAVAASGHGHSRHVVTLVDRVRGRSHILDGHPLGVNVMAFSPDGRTLATGDTTGVVKLWDMATLKARASLRVNRPGAQSLVFSPDGSRLATLVSVDHVIMFWDVATGESPGAIPVEDSAVFAFAFAPDGTTMAAAGADGLITLWDVREWRKLGSVGDRGRPLYAVSFSSDGRRIATGGAEGNVCLWDVSAIRREDSRHGS